MTSNSTNSAALQSPAEAAIPLLDDWFDPIEAGRRDRVRGFIQGMIEAELEAALSRRRYARRQRRLPRMLMARAVSPATAWPPIAVASGDLRAGRDRGAAGPARQGADRPRDPRRHRGAGPARSEGPPRSCCWSCSACVRSARSCCWPSRTWGARPARRSAPSSTISSGAGCVSRTSWWSTAGPGCSRRWPHSGATCRPNAARSTSTATCWPMLPNAGMRRFRPTIPT